MITLTNKFFRFSKIKVPSIAEVQQTWNEYSSEYSTFDLGPQTFYYSLVTMM